jgi:purine-nucleoside phosphorylase
MTRRERKEKVLFDKINEAVRVVREKTPLKPQIAIILGTGLGGLAEDIEDKVGIPYSEIPHFPTPTVETHAGRLVLGKISGKDVVAMEGRIHYYEGYSMEEVTFPTRVMRALGAEILIISTAAGGMNPQYARGDIVVIEDHINLMGANPLIGPNDERLGPRYPDMCEPYDRRLIELADQVALEQAVKAHKGVYVGVAGPNLETRAEYRFLREIGADVVGMSTVPEVLVAVHGGLRTLGLAVVTDMCLPDALQPANIEQIIAVAEEAEPKLTSLVKELIARI